jgi:hypothetical protein
MSFVGIAYLVTFIVDKTGDVVYPHDLQTSTIHQKMDWRFTTKKPEDPSI